MIFIFQFDNKIHMKYVTFHRSDKMVKMQMSMDINVANWMENKY
jgi:hypothetical protein